MVFINRNNNDVSEYIKTVKHYNKLNMTPKTTKANDGLMLHASESQIQAGIVEYLQVMEKMGQLLFIRNNSFAGKIMRGDQSMGYINNAKKGSSDLLVFIDKGRTLHLEVKTHKGKLKPDQKIWRDKSEKLGHIFRVVRSIDDVEDIIKFYTKKQ